MCILKSFGRRIEIAGSASQVLAPFENLLQADLLCHKLLLQNHFASTANGNLDVYLAGLTTKCNQMTE